MPYGSGYSPHVRVDEQYLPVVFLLIPDVARFGLEFECFVEFRYPVAVDCSAFVPGVEFDVLEGPRRVGIGRVLP